MAEVACGSLSKRFGDVAALRDVTCAAPAGGVLLVLGPSGAGKTTLLRLIAGLERPDAGTVRIGDETVTGPGVLVAPHRRGVAFVFQRPTLWPHLTAVENVALALVGRGLRRRERRHRAAAMLDSLAMADRARAHPATLSGGERQRVGLARALVVQPKVLLLDEPFASLDVDLRKGLVETLARLKSEHGVTMLWVTHRSEEALALADRLVLLRDGAVEDAGEVEAVLTRPRTAFSARFLTDANVLRGRVDRPGRAVTVLGEVVCDGRQVDETVLVAVPPDAFALGLSPSPLMGEGWGGGETVVCAFSPPHPDPPPRRGEGTTNDDLRATVERAEFRGRYFAYVVRIGDERVRVHLKDRLTCGDEVSLRLTAPPSVVEE